MGIKKQFAASEQGFLVCIPPPSGSTQLILSRPFIPVNFLVKVCSPKPSEMENKGMKNLVFKNNIVIKD
jgi:hypothetical protein